MGETVLVCGGRRYNNREAVFEMLDAMPRIGCIVHGAATGADSLADEWAISRKVNRIICPANWEGEGRGAGFFRNERMILKIKPIHYVVQFPGGPGTDHMCRYAKKFGIPVKAYLTWKAEQERGGPSAEELLS